MRRLAVTTFLTLDGVMQAPGGPDEDRSGGFEYGGWLVPYADDDMATFVAEWFAAADAFLLGRRTYEIFASYWPHVTDESDPVASKLNHLPKYVASTTLDTVTWNNSTLVKGDLVEEITRLKEQPGGEIQVHGSGELLQTLMKHDLIDEYRLWFYPVIVGAGKRLFREGGIPTALGLLEAKTTSTGVVIHTYERGGRFKTGSFESPKKTNRSTAKSIDEYLTELPLETQKILQQVRAAIRETAPDATETMSYAIPTFDLHGHHLVHFAGFAKHVGFYPVTEAASEAFGKELESYKRGKGSVQFPLNRPVPFDLIRRMVAFRVAESTQQAASSRRRSTA